MAKGKNVEAIMESLRNPVNWKIGVYGMGGCGKTSTMKFITDELTTAGEYHASSIVWITVSEDLNSYEVQDQIAEKLFLRLRFYKDNKFLIVLDDVWEVIPLDKVEFPENRCKMVVLTRSLAVCRGMGTHKTIRMELLSDEEALNMLVKDMPFLMTRELRHLAEKFVRECFGLPLAIQALGHEMSKKAATGFAIMKEKFDTNPWMELLMDLRSSPIKVEGMEPVFNTLQLSYMHLTNDLVRKCFLHLAFFPKGYHLEANELISYWMAEFMNEEGDFETIREKGFEILNELVDACLFEKFSDLASDNITMHNLTRELAISILELEGDMLIKADLGLSVPLKGNEWKKPRKVSLMKNMIEVLPDEPNSPKLTVLFFREYPLSQNISSSFFNKIPTLEILDLSHTSISELPSSLSKLHTLQALFLQQCTSLVKIPSLAKLKKLRMLNLSHTGIKELPHGMEGLVSLFSLDLSYALDLYIDSLWIDEETKISSTIDHIDVPYEQPNWPNLSNLLLQGNHLSHRMPSSFFNHMPTLEILDLSHTNISELPSSLSNMLNLRELLLQECTLLNKIPSLAKLKKLRILNLSRTSIKELPHGTEVLVNLSSLDFSYRLNLEMDSLRTDEERNNSSTKNEPNILYEQPNWSKLSNLSLRGNHLVQRIPTPFFKHTSALEILDEERNNSSTKNEPNILYEQPNWSKLSNLSLRGNHLVQRIPTPFFKHTSALEILDLSQTSISELPSSLSDLLNLHELCLQECSSLEKIPSLDKLKKLRTLNLSRTAIEQLPEGVEGSISLKSLDISFTYHLQRCVISQLAFLEELHIEGSKICMMDSLSLFNAMEDIRHFNHLAILTLSFVKLEDYLKTFSWLSWGRFQNFGIQISDTLDLFVNYYTEFSPKSMFMHNQKISNYSSTLRLPLNTEELRLSLCDIPRLSELLCLRRVKFLNKGHIERCSLSSGNCLILGDEMKEQSLASLQHLSLENVKGLGVLWKGAASSPFLTNLRVLEVHGCGSLKNLFCVSFLHHFKNIEVIKVALCRLLDEIVSDVQSPRDSGSTTTPVCLPKLHTLILKDLPKLQSISRKMWICVSMRHVEVTRCMKLRKLPFGIEDLSCLVKIRGEIGWFEALELADPDTRNLLQSQFQPIENGC